MKPSNLDKQYACRVSTRQVGVGLKPDLRLIFHTSITIAIILFTCIPAANAGTLGRLFFTPEQRTQLDYTYARTATTDGGTSPVLTVNGIVQKNGGARTVWVNGVAQSENNSRERTPTAQTVAIPGSHPVKLKVGEKILLDQPAQSNSKREGE